MKKSIIKTVVLAALMALPMFTKAQTFAGITAERECPESGIQDMESEPEERNVPQPGY